MFQLVREIYGIFKSKKANYFIWLFANLGGLLLAYFAALIIWFYYKQKSILLPGYEIYLITGTVSLAISGVSYLRLKFETKDIELNSFMKLSWPFLLMLVFGVLISIGLEKPVISDFQIWVSCIVISFLLMLWASIMWLHEQGLRDRVEPMKPNESPELTATADKLPKV